MPRGGPILVELEAHEDKLATLVTGRVPVDGSGVTQPVSGPVTDAQLRATAVPISAATLPLPTGAALDDTLASILTELQAKTEPADTQPVSGPLTDTQLRATAVPVSGTITANAGTGPFPVSDNGGSLTVDAPVGTPLRVDPTGTTTQPVSGTVTANPATGAGKTLTYVSVNQSAAGTTVLAAASVGNKHKGGLCR